jgi:hypothetical protein
MVSLPFLHLLPIYTQPTDAIISSAVLVLKYLVQSQLHLSLPVDITSTTHPSSPITIISHLARKIDDIRHPQARACVLWLVGQYAGTENAGAGGEGVAEWAPDVLRKGAKGFMQEVILTINVLCPLLTHKTRHFPGPSSQTPNNNPRRQTPRSKPFTPYPSPPNPIRLLTSTVRQGLRRP